MHATKNKNESATTPIHLMAVIITAPMAIGQPMSIAKWLSFHSIDNYNDQERDGQINLNWQALQCGGLIDLSDPRDRISRWSRYRDIATTSLDTFAETTSVMGWSSCRINEENPIWIKINTRTNAQRQEQRHHHYPQQLYFVGRRRMAPNNKNKNNSKINNRPTDPTSYTDV